MIADLSNLFLLGEDFIPGAVRADFTCDIADIYKWVSGECTRTITLKQCEGEKLCDLIGTTATLRLISKRVQEALISERITGWRTCPIEFKDKKGELIDNYGALATVGRCGPLDNSRCRKITRKALATDELIDVFLGYYFDEDSWDGSDLFRPEGTRMTMVTQRAKDVIESISATNIEFKPILEIESLMLL